MRVRNLDIGVERITRWQVSDEFHLPAEERAAPAFLPQPRHLDEILRRPSLDERLVDLLRPDAVDPNLLDPATLSRTRHEIAGLLGDAARAGHAAAGTFAAAVEILNADSLLDEEVRAALALLLRA